MDKIPPFNEFLNEIRAEDAYQDASSIQTVISGKRDMAFLAITAQRMIDPRDAIAALSEAINRGLKILPLKGRLDGVAFIVYRRNESAAKKLAEFAESKGGYLNDETAEEAEFIGRMLSYDEEDIKKFVDEKYKKK
jgi:hypothetical protein